LEKVPQTLAEAAELRPPLGSEAKGTSVGIGTPSNKNALTRRGSGIRDFAVALRAGSGSIILINRILVSRDSPTVLLAFWVNEVRMLTGSEKAPSTA
jgi:hypothetical protein